MIAFSIVGRLSGKMLERFQRLLEVRYRLLSGRAARGFLAGLMEIFHRLFPQLAAERVVREPLNLFGYRRSEYNFSIASTMRA